MYRYMYKTNMFIIYDVQKKTRKTQNINDN